MLKDCARCGSRRETAPARGSGLCHDCHDAKYAPKLCCREGCEEVKAPGRGQKLCAAHAQESRMKFPKQMSPCRKCGTLEGKQKGKQFCDACAATQREVAAIKKKHKKTQNRKVCAGCFKKKEGGLRRRYCEACLAERASDLRVCGVCGEKKKLAKYAKACEECRGKSRDRARARNRAYQARQRADPDRAEILRERSRRQKRGGREKENEAKRMQYRLRRMIEGVPVPDAEIKGTAAVVPVAPIMPLLREWVEKMDDDDERGGRAVLADRSGISERRIYDVFVNGQENIALDTADAFCMAIGTHYAIVYDGIEPKGRKNQ